MYSISGAAKGNFTMLDNLGVPINDTILSAYALEKGLKQSVEQMTIGEKVALAMRKFMEDTAYAAGNYARENETAAGSMATLQAAWSNFLAGNLGFDRVVDSAYNAMSIALKTVGLDAYQPFLDSARDTVNEVVRILGMEDTGGGDSKTKQIADLLSAKFAAVFDDLAETAPAAVEKLFTGITEVLTSLETVLPSATQAGLNIFDAVRQGFEQAKAPLLSAAQSIAGDAVGAFLSFKGDMLTTGLEFIGAFAQGISDDLARGEDSEIQKALNEGIGDVLEAMTFSIPAMGKAAVGLIRALAQSLGDESVATELSNMVSTLIGDIGALLADGEFWSGLGNAVLNIGTGLLTGIFDGLGQAAANIWNAIANQDDGSVPESVKTLQKAFAGILTDSRAAEGAYASAMGDIQARAELAEKYLDVLQAYEQLEDPDEAMTQDALNATQALLNLYPQLKENIDSNTGFFSDNTAAIRANIAALQDLARQQAYEKLTGEMTAAQADLIVQKVNIQAEIERLKAEAAEQQKLFDAIARYSENGQVANTSSNARQTVTDQRVVKAMQDYLGSDFDAYYQLNQAGEAVAKGGFEYNDVYASMWRGLYDSQRMTLNNGMDAQRVAQALSRETTRQVRALGRRKG